jgi:hypothetical protein
MKADLHIHTMHSVDSIAKPHSILAAAADRDIQVIAVTDHDTTAAWRTLSETACRYPVAVVYGQEVSIYKGGHSAGSLLCLFLSKPIVGHDINDVLDQVRDQDGIAAIAHPFSQRLGEFRAYDQIENWDRLAVEVSNGRVLHPRDNEMASRMAERLELGITAGSNAHTPFEVGNTALHFDGRTVQDLKRAIRYRDVSIEGKSSSVLFSALSEFGRLGLAV